MSRDLKEIRPALTILETGEAVLAKRIVGELFPLRYGNETQARTKIADIKDGLKEAGKRADVVRRGGRFLVLVFDEDTAAASRIQVDGQAKTPFATVAGSRSNPRNRHNHKQEDCAEPSKPYYYQTNI